MTIERKYATLVPNQIRGVNWYGGEVYQASLIGREIVRRLLGVKIHQQFCAVANFERPEMIFDLNVSIIWMN